MSKFHPEQFIATEHNTAADKARFANHFVKFVEGNMKKELFPQWFYKRLSMMFGHIAHYDRDTFYNKWFATMDRRLSFMANIMVSPKYGQPEYTWVDVEKALAEWAGEVVVKFELVKEVLNATRWYVTMTWDDWPGGGSYGTIIEAATAEEAEKLCRMEMAASRAGDDMSAEEYLEAYGDEWEEVDCFKLDEFIKRHQR